MSIYSEAGLKDEPAMQPLEVTRHVTRRVEGHGGSTMSPRTSSIKNLNEGSPKAPKFRRKKRA